MTRQLHMSLTSIVLYLSLKTFECVPISKTFKSEIYDKVYFHHTGYSTFDDAIKFCQQHDGRLWEPTSKAEQDYIQSQIPWNFIWLGIDIDSKFGNYSHFLSGATINWTNWLDWESYELVQQNTHGGVYLRRDGNPTDSNDFGGWMVASCDDTSGVVCEGQSSDFNFVPDQQESNSDNMANNPPTGNQTLINIERGISTMAGQISDIMRQISDLNERLATIENK